MEELLFAGQTNEKTIGLPELLPAPVPIRIFDALYGEGVAPTHEHSAQSLIDVQNSTIASLMQEIDSWRSGLLRMPSRFDVPPFDLSLVTHLQEEIDIMHAQIKATSRAFSSLSASLGDAVEASLSKRLPAHVGVLPDPDKFVTKNDLLEFVEDNKTLVLSAHQDAIEVSGDTCKSAIASLLDKLPPLLDKSKDQCFAHISKLDARLDELSALLDTKIIDVEKGLELSQDDEFSSIMAQTSAATDASAVPRPPVELRPRFFVGDLVRLHSLKAVSFNDMIGEIISFNENADRYGVRLTSGEEKAFKVSNLHSHAPDDTDRCPTCYEYINLFALPPCDCFLPRGHSSTSSTEAAPCF